MKKLFIIAIALLGIIMTTKAQGTQFGFKGGLNVASLTGDVSEDFKSRTSFHFGIVTEIEISEGFTIQPELLYSAQGAKDKVNDEALKIDYLNMPVMGKYYVTEFLNVEVGPQIGFLLSAKSEIDGADNEDIKNSIKDIDFGLNFGIGYKLNGGLNFGARYNLGLSNMDDEVKSDEFKVHNGVFQISMGYYF